VGNIAITRVILLSTSTPLASSRMSATTHRRLPPAEVDCRWWIRGYCARGGACYFKHDAAMFAAEMRQDQSTSASSSIQPARTPANNAGEGIDAIQTHLWLLLTFIAVSQTCAICFERPDTYGLLVNCDHTFCLGMPLPGSAIRI
jgi:E3 ubiquitin-protein ligase makorin